MKHQVHSISSIYEIILFCLIEIPNKKTLKFQLIPLVSFIQAHMMEFTLIRLI